MAWPSHLPAGQIFPARALQDDIIMTCQTRLADPALAGSMRVIYDLILAHAYLDRHNHAHGLLRDFVKSNGDGVGANGAAKTANLDAAWGNVMNAYNNVMLPSPTLVELQTALNGIDHGGGGGVVV